MKSRAKSLQAGSRYALPETESKRTPVNWRVLVGHSCNFYPKANEARCDSYRVIERARL